MLPAFVERLPGALADFLDREHGRGNHVRRRLTPHTGEIDHALQLLEAVKPKAEITQSSAALTIFVSSCFFDEIRHSREVPSFRQLQETTPTWIHVYAPSDDRELARRLEETDEVLLGRDQELARLRRAAATAADGRLTLALVTGEPGIGKSSLADALSRQLRADGWTITWGNCPKREGNPPGQPWTEVLQGLVDRFTPEHEAQLAPLLDDHATLRAAGDVPAARFQLHTAVGYFLRAVSRVNPLLVVLDDLHDADGEGLALLAHVVDALVDAPVLVVASYRQTDVREQLAETLAALAAHQPEHIALTGLDADRVADLLAALCTRTLATETITAITERTEGNPFFVREIARLLETDGEHAAIGKVPPSIRHLLRRRVARLSTGARTVLQVAAVIGRDFGVDVLTEVAGIQEGTLIECLDSALRAGLLVEPRAPQRSLRFAHTLMSDTLYDDISSLRRTALHARVGEAMERLRPDDVVGLAHHFNAAQAPATAAKATHYLRLAAEHAERRLAYREAAGFWQQAVLANAHAPGATVRDRLELVLPAIRTLATAGQHQAARDARDAALAEVIGLRDEELTARVIVAYDAQSLWPHHPYATTDDRIVELIDRTLRDLPSDQQDLRCQLLACLAIELEHAGDPRGDHASWEAVTLARQLRRPALLATALNGRFRQSYWTGDLAERDRIGLELLLLGQEHNLVAVEATGRSALIRCASGRGDFTAADEHVAELERLATTYELPTAAASAAWYRGLRHIVSGRFGDAERTHQHAIELTSQAGMADIEQGFFPMASLSLAWWMDKLADRVEACRLARGRWPLPGTEAYALSLAAAGRLAEARAVATRRMPLPKDICFKIVMALRGLVGLALNDVERITEAYRELRQLDDEIAGGDTGAYAVLFPIAQLLGDLAERLGQARAANAHYQKALEVANRADVARWVTTARDGLTRTIHQSRPRRAW